MTQDTAKRGMLEIDYLNAQNLTRLRIASQILREVVPFASEELLTAIQIINQERDRFHRIIGELYE